MLRRHIAITIIAVLSGASVVLPLLHSDNTLQKNVPAAQSLKVFSPVSDDESYYASRIAAVMRGDTHARDPYFFSDLPVTLPFAAELLVGSIGRFFGMSLATVIRLIDFLSPLLIMIGVYVLLLIATAHRSIGIVGATIVSALLFPVLTRPISPQINLLVLIAVLCVCAYVMFKQSHRIPSAIIGSILLGMLVRMYFYYWSFVAVLFVILIAWCVYKKDISRARLLGVILCGGLIIGAQTIATSFALSTDSVGSEILFRFGEIKTHRPSGLVMAACESVLIIAWSALVRWKKVDINQAAIGIIFPFAAFVASNHHIVTGSNILFSSHYQHPALLACIVSGALLVSQYSGHRFFKNVIIMGSVVALAALSVSAWKLSLYWRIPTPEAQTIARFTPVFEYLRANKKGSVFVYNKVARNWMSAYAGVPVASAPYAFMYPVSNKELIDRYVAVHYGDVITREHLVRDQLELWGQHYLVVSGHSRFTGGTSEQIPVEQIIAAQQLAQKNGFAQSLSQFGVRYVVVDDSEDPQWLHQEAAKLVLVMRINEFSIYKVE